jgi:hypothetical protein
VEVSYKDRGYEWDPDKDTYKNHKRGTSVVKKQWNKFHAHTSTEPHHTNAVLDRSKTKTRGFRTLDAAFDHLERVKK